MVDINKREKLKVAEYSIKDLERLTGIKAHTLRIWEKRYTIMEPSRTSTNIRFYGDEDLKRILNVAVLNNHGVKISAIAKMSQTEISDHVMKLSESVDDAEVHIDQLTIAMIDVDEIKFEGVISDVSQKMGFENFVLKVLYPFLNKIGVLWHTGNVNPAQEHFITHLIRQKLIVAVDSLPIHSNKKLPNILFFLPENELHELGLLFYTYLAKKMGYGIVYLGQSVPYSDLNSVVNIRKPKILITAMSSPLPNSALKEYVKKISRDYSAFKIFIAGYQVTENIVKPYDNVVRVDNALSLKQDLEQEMMHYL